MLKNYFPHVPIQSQSISIITKKAWINLLLLLKHHPKAKNQNQSPKPANFFTKTNKKSHFLKNSI